MEYNSFMDEEETVSHYLEIGAIEIIGVEDDGQFIFNITQSAKQLAPELWNAHIAYVDEMLIELFEKGLINVTYNENLEAHIELTDNGRQILTEYGIVDMSEDN
jgi:hypothetical protein